VQRIVRASRCPGVASVSKSDGRVEFKSYLCITRLTAYGEGDDGESVYGENADFRSGLGICT
jgi:hypothetical protein